MKTGFLQINCKAYLDFESKLHKVVASDFCAFE